LAGRGAVEEDAADRGQPDPVRVEGRQRDSPTRFRQRGAAGREGDGGGSPRTHHRMRHLPDRLLSLARATSRSAIKIRSGSLLVLLRLSA
jgi:hypothetical protein